MANCQKWEDSFDCVRQRLNYLELWRELAIRPSSFEDCHPNDHDLMLRRPELDDCQVLACRCFQVRRQMNRLLPEMEKTLYENEDLILPGPSKIPDAGEGLFFQPRQQDNEILPKDSTICYYWGDIHNFHSSKQVSDKSYLMWVGDEILVDPGPRPSIKARYINDPWNDDSVNCIFVPEPNKYRSKVVATRDIVSGEELFASYGNAYWTNSNVNRRCYVPTIITLNGENTKNEQQ